MFIYQNGKGIIGNTLRNLNGGKINKETAENIIRPATLTKAYDGTYCAFVSANVNVGRLRVPGYLKDVLVCKDLFIEYPELASMPIVIVDNPAKNGYITCGSFHPVRKFIDLNKQCNDKILIGTIRHETQHAIQQIECISGGSNTQVEAERMENLFGNASRVLKLYMAMDKNFSYVVYTRNPGQTEARAAEDDKPFVVWDGAFDTKDEMDFRRKMAKFFSVESREKKLALNGVSPSDAFFGYSEKDYADKLICVANVVAKFGRARVPAIIGKRLAGDISKVFACHYNRKLGMIIKE